MNIRRNAVLGILGAMALAGCAAESGERGSDAEARERSTCSATDVAGEGAIGTKGITWNGVTNNGIDLNGPVLNGWNLNGLTLNGWSLNGIELNGIALNGTTLNGTQLQGTKLNGGVLQGTTLNGQVLQGTTLQGAELTGLLSDGSTLPLFIDEVRANPKPENADVPLYAVSVGDERLPLCGRNDDGSPVLAAALANEWDARTGARIDTPDRFTFACQGAALYKCVDAGYKPWKSAELAEYHQACTRMIRADYCGDGTSYTKNGTLIDMGDGAGVQTFEADAHPELTLEATWGPNGATCVAKTRYRLSSIPSCLADRLADSCDTNAAAEGGVRLANRSGENACLR